MGKTVRLTMLLILALLLSLTGPASASGTAGGGAVVGYYAAWAAGQGYTPDSVPAELFTQINYAFAVLEDGRLTLGDPARDEKALAGLTALRRRNAGLKIVLSAGGWDGSAGFSDAAATASGRRAFAQSCVDLIVKHGLDGVDLDWEYPVSGGAAGVVHRAGDRENFTLLLRAVRDALDSQGKRDGRRYVLSVAGAAGGGYLRHIEPQAVADLTDHIFLMAYDFHGPWDTSADLNAPLSAPDGGPDSVDGGVSAWLSQGVPAEKLVLGIPLYGYLYQGVSGRNGGLRSGFGSARSVSWDRIKSDYLGNSAYAGFRREEVPCLYGRGCFLSYDDEVSVAAKARLAQARGLGGVGFWELSQDSSGDLIQSACSAWSGAGFLDVPRDAWYAGAVERVCGAGLMQGTGAGRFSPGEAVTRGQIAAVLYRLAGSPAVSGASFADVGQSAYYGKAVAWAARQGIVEGFPDGTFRPDLPVSRQQLAAILWRFAGLEGADSGRRSSLEPYRDAGQAGAYAAEPLRWALAEGILQGTGEGDLQPLGQAARGQTAVMLSRFCDLLESRR